MPAPGTTVSIVESAPTRTPPTDTGVWFVSGITEKGPLAPRAFAQSSAFPSTVVESLADFQRLYGGRVTYGTLYDAIDTFFREGGSRAYVARVVGPAPAYATLSLLDGGVGVSLIVTARNPGAWPNAATVAVSAGVAGGTFVLTIVDPDGNVTVSPDLLDTAAAVAWGAALPLVSIALGASPTDPAVRAPTNLAGGADDRASITEAQWTAALARFVAELGPGQVSAPGRTTDAAHQALNAHAGPAHNRVALLDGVDTATAATLIAAAAAARGSGRYGALFAPWATVPGVAGLTTRTVPYSAVAAGLIARNDAAGGNPNIAAAGVNGQAVYATGLSQAAFSDSDRAALNDAGVNVAIVKYGAVRSYGFRSLADPAADPGWTQFTNARLVMAYTAEAEAVAERYVFAQIDGQDHTIGDFNGDLKGVAMVFYNDGALYGATSDEAFSVNTGANVNTAATKAAGEIHADVVLRISPFGEKVEIHIAKRAVTESVA